MGESSFRYGAYAAEDRDAFTRVLHRCFGQTGDYERIERWVGTLDRGEVRTLRDGERLVGTLVGLPMGQVFGGRGVPTLGVAGVGVEPDARGRGAARALLESFLREAREREFPISTLYPSTYTFYRSLGYERAGARWWLEVSPESLAGVRVDAAVRPADAGDEPLLRELWSRFAALHAGQLMRNDYVRQRARGTEGKETHTVVVEVDGAPEGYVRWRQDASQDGPYSLVLTDVVALSRRAGEGVLGFLAGHRSLAPKAAWASGPGDPLRHLLPERRYDLAHRDDWMVRVLDVGRALEARGYAPGLVGRVELEVEDRLLPDAGGKWTLEVEDGVGRARRGGSGAVSLSERGFAALYTGHLTAQQLAVLEQASGDPDELARASGFFAGPAPWMSDMF